MDIETKLSLASSEMHLEPAEETPLTGHAAFAQTAPAAGRPGPETPGPCGHSPAEWQTLTREQKRAAPIHLAAMPGLTASWTHFDDYMTCNVQATQRLLEAIRQTQVRLQRFILGSTSSVYGKYASGDESSPTKPFSPYGVTKLAAEHLAHSYAENHGLPLVTLRFFSVYGPRQRPDMGYNKFIQALLAGTPITLFGDGKQVRGNTYIHDCVAAIEASMQAPVHEILNIGGGEMANVWDILSLLERISQRKVKVNKADGRPGDQRYTMADTSRLARHTGWVAQTPLEEGLTQQFLWQQRLHEQQSKEARRAA